MITREYDKQQKTALNIIWNAAGKYDILPPFMAFNSDGEADFYFNIIIGLSIKWMDIDKLNRFFLSYQSAEKCDSFDRISWLYLENFLYNKEINERPVLKKLRFEYAKEFISKKGHLSRHEMMLNDIRVYEQEMYRWESLIFENKDDIENNKKYRKKLSKKAFALAKLLEKYDENATTEEIIDNIKNILVGEFNFSNFRIDIEHANYVPDSLKHILKKMLNHENQHIDSLLTRSDIKGDYLSNKLTNGYKNKHISYREDADIEYIKSCFGPCIYSEHEINILENELCRDNHDYCKLWITKQNNSKVKNYNIGESALIDKEVMAQYIRNKNYFEKEKLIIEASVKKLSSNLETIFSTYMKPLPVISKTGKLNSEKSYRLDILNDPYVFTKAGDEVENSIIIDILLDASASRNKYQEQIASQAYILVKSLLKINIPVRLLDFHSLRGYTVIQILKDYDDKNLSGIFKYFAAGWNRDGLALLTTDRISYSKNVEAKKILIFMTDANPEDSLKMPPETGSIFNRSYAGFEGINDTENIVKKLENNGVYIGSVYTGPNIYVDNAKLIYGNNYVRVQDIKNLSNSIFTLIQNILRKLKN